MILPGYRRDQIHQVLNMLEDSEAIPFTAHYRVDVWATAVDSDQKRICLSLMASKIQGGN